MISQKQMVANFQNFMLFCELLSPAAKTRKLRELNNVSNRENLGLPKLMVLQ